MDESWRGPAAEGDQAPTRRFIRRFGWHMATVLAVFSVVAIFGVYLRTGVLIQEFAIDGARSLADLVAETTSWSAEHGGAWLRDDTSAPMSRFLTTLGVSQEATTTDGRTFTLYTHVELVRDLSADAGQAGNATFRFVSLRPLDPADGPDAWEAASLGGFVHGSTEAWTRTTAAGVPVLRYMRPLRVIAPCLPCHAKQGYRVGDLGGAVSVTVPLDSITKQAAAGGMTIAGVDLLFAVALVLIASGFVWRLQRQVHRSQRALVEAATIDDLTRLWTRRHTMERLAIEIDRAERTSMPLALIMADIDRFKGVNDTYGHATGDVVLTEIARRIGRTMRPYDILGRIGGEEFLIVAPGADLEDAVALAERARAAVSASPVIADKAEVHMTVSFGVTLVDPKEPSALDRALDRADDALYATKESERGRVSVQEPG